MAASAVSGFIGVLLGSVTTAVLTVYREQVVSRREREARERQRMQERQDQRDTLQRQSLLALQDAVSDLVKAVFNEQDRMLEEMRRTEVASEIRCKRDGRGSGFVVMLGGGTDIVGAGVVPGDGRGRCRLFRSIRGPASLVQLAGGRPGVRHRAHVPELVGVADRADRLNLPVE